AETVRTCPEGPPNSTVAVPRATPRASCALPWKWWNGCTPSRYAGGQRLAANTRSTAAASAGTALRYTSRGSREFGIAPSSPKLKVNGSVIRSFPSFRTARRLAASLSHAERLRPLRQPRIPHPIGLGAIGEPQFLHLRIQARRCHRRRLQRRQMAEVAHQQCLPL